MNYPKLYYTNPEKWGKNHFIYPFFILSTKEFNYFLWVKELITTNPKKSWNFIWAQFDKLGFFINSYIFENDEEEKTIDCPYDARRVNTYLIEHPEEIKEELNPQQLLTHPNKNLREFIRKILNSDESISN